MLKTLKGGTPGAQLSKSFFFLFVLLFVSFCRSVFVPQEMLRCSPSFSLLIVMTSIAQLLKTSEYVCTGKYPAQASAVFLNELVISLDHS